MGIGDDYYRVPGPEDFLLPGVPEITGEAGPALKDLLEGVCRDPEIRPLAGGRRILLDRDAGDPFKVSPGGVVRFNPARAGLRPATTLHLRHAFELCLWLEIAGQDPSPEDRAAAAVLACRTAAVYWGSRLAAEQEQMSAGAPSWLVRGLELLQPPGPVPPGRDGELINLAIDLMGLQEVEAIPGKEAVGRCWPAILRRLQETWEVASPTEHLLTTGGDSRLKVDRTTGLNNFGCSPRPRPWAVTFASSTASSISDLAFGRAEKIRGELVRAAWQGGLEEAFAETMAGVRTAIGRIWCRSGECRVILTNSGTDAEALVLHFGLCAGPQPLVNLVVAPEETGGGVLLAASGRNFTSEAPDGKRLRKGELIEGLASDRVALETSPVRAAGASLIPRGQVDARVEEVTRGAVEKGARVLLHFVDASKTGISVPTLACLDRLLERWGQNIDVVVDACQLRLSRTRMEEYLGRGCLVIITGSKFYTGPPFSGAILVPAKLYERILKGGPAPIGLRRFSSRHEWPRSWAAVSKSLPRRRNLGLLLRWSAALWEMRAFHAVPAADRFNILSSFGWEVLAAILRNSDLRLVSFPVPPRPLGRDLVVWDRLPTIFTFAPMLHRPSGEPRPLTLEEAGLVYRWLNTDISKWLPGGASAGEAVLAARRFHIGQPVEMIGRGDEKLGALRISAGARLVSGVAFDPELGPAPPQRLGREIGDALAALEKISLILRYFHEIKEGHEEGRDPDRLHLI